MTLRKERFASNPYHTGVFNGADFTISSETDTGTSTGTSNQVSVNVQLKDAAKDVAQRVSGFCYLSDDANGDSVAVTAPSSVSAGVDGTLTALVAGKVFLFTSEADGQFDVNIIRTVADTYYLVIVSPDGSRIISEAITFV
jgi:hypothetical protein